MGHDHHRHHPHHHHSGRGSNILFAGLLNLSFTIIEFIGGLLTNSVAILSDALHDLGDTIALLSAYFAEKQAEKPSDAKRTFGYARISVFSALLNAVILIVGSIFILTEAVQRLFSPEPVEAVGMILLAVFGVAVNLAAYLRLRKGLSANENVLSWHLLEDVIGWVAVLIGAIIIYFTDFFLIDPLLTIGYTLFILLGVWGGLKNVMNVLMQGVPASVSVQEVEAALAAVPGVEGVHDVHVWSLDGAESVLTCHVVVADRTVSDTKQMKEAVEAAVASFHILHTTIEFETPGECIGVVCNGLGDAATKQHAHLPHDSQHYDKHS